MAFMVSLLIAYCEYQQSWLVSGVYNWGFAVRDTLLFVNSAYGVDVISFAAPDQPRRVASIMTPGLAFDVVVSGNTAYICDDYRGVEIFDVSDAANPVPLGYIDTPGLATSIFVNGNTAYVADDWNGLRIIDVSDPANPVELGFYDTEGRAIDVVVADTLAYVSDYRNGLLVIDVSEPSDPQVLGCWQDSVVYVWAVALSDTLAYVTGDYLVGGILKNFIVLDVSDPSSPAYVTGISLPEPPNAFVLEDTIAFVSDQSSGIRVISVADPMYPQEINYIPGNHLNGLTVAESLLFAPYGWQGYLHVYDISDLTAIQHIGTFTPGPYVTSVLTAQDRLFVETLVEDPAILAFDCTVPDSICLLDSLTFAAGTGALLWDAPYLYAGQGSAWSILDFSGDSLQQLCSVSGCTNDMEKDDSVVFCGGTSLRIYDVSDPIAPELISSLSVACDHIVRYDTLILAAGDHAESLHVINVADPGNPVRVTSLSNERPITSLALAAPYVFVGNYDWWLQVVDVSDPGSPQIVNTLYTPNFDNNQIVVKDSILYAAGGYYWGVRIFDITDPAAPILIDSCDTPGWAQALTITGDRIYCADEVTLSLIRFSGTWIAEAGQNRARLEVRAYPNPFTNVVRFDGIPIDHGPYPQSGVLRIFDCAGRLLRTLYLGKKSTCIWDGRDEHGGIVPVGVYFVHLTSAGRSARGKIIRVK